MAVVARQQTEALEFNVGAALSNDDAAGFRLKYTQLTLNWPAPIMGPAYRRVFIRSTRMYGRPALFLPSFYDYVVPCLRRSDKRISSSCLAASLSVEIRARDRHVWPSCRVESSRLETRALFYLTRCKLKPNTCFVSVQLSFFFLFSFFFFLFTRLSSLCCSSPT